LSQKTFRCRLITPDAKVLDAKASAAVIPAWDGQMGIQPDRAAMVAKLGPGELRIEFPPAEGPNDIGGGTRAYFVEGGFAHMIKNELTLLASKAIPEESLTESAAQAELNEVMSRQPTTTMEPARIEKLRMDRVRAEAKLRAARNFRARGGGI